MDTQASHDPHEGGDQTPIPPSLRAFGEDLSLSLDACDPQDYLPQIKAALQEQLKCCDVVGRIKPECCEKRHYGRELVYVDPEKRFTLLVLRWLPRAATPVHGHNAWGVVGVCSGELTICCYDAPEGKECLEKTKEIKGKPGDVSCVGPVPEGIHCISNTSEEEAYSIHVYGMDLSEKADAINVYYE